MSMRFLKNKSGGISDYFYTDTNGNVFGDNFKRYIRKLPTLDAKDTVTIASTFSDATYLEEMTIINTEKIKSMQSAFSNCTRLKSVNITGENVATTIASMFSNCTALEEISTIYAGACTKVSSMFQNCKSLTNFGGLIDLGKAYTTTTENDQNCYLNLSACTLLTHESLMNVINNLYDLNSKNIYTTGDFSEEAIKTVATMYPEYWNSDEYFWVAIHLNKDSYRYRFYCFKNIGSTKVYLTDNTGQHYDFSNNEFIYVGQVQLYDNGWLYEKDLFNGKYYDNQHILDNNSWCTGGISMMYSSSTQSGNVTQGALYKNCNVYTNNTLSELFFEQKDVYKQQLSLGETNLAKLTADEIAIATNKGWNVE